MDLSHWIALAVVVLPVIGLGLKLLGQQSFIAKNAAWSAIVAGAINIVAQIEAELKANPDATRDQLIAAGIAELRQVYVDSFAKLGGTAVSDAVLTLLFQRIAARLPTSVDTAISDFLGSPSVSGGSALMSMPRAGRRFARPVGQA